MIVPKVFGENLIRCNWVTLHEVETVIVSYPGVGTVIVPKYPGKNIN